AMRIARQRSRTIEDNEDPDPYGYAQEVENTLGVDITPPRWKSKPDDERWVQRIRGRARKAEVSRMFLEGRKVPEIAQHCGVSEITILKDLQLISEEYRRSYLDDIELLAGKDLERLESYLAALAPQIGRGDVKAVMAAVEIIKERASILGYHQGVQVDITQLVTEVAEANGFDPSKALAIAT